MTDLVKLSRDQFDPASAIRFEYKLAEATDEKKKNGILCSVEGVFQRSDVENLNKRTYPRTIFEKLFNHPKFKEQLEKRRMVGMLYHPANGQTDPEKIAHVVTRQELMSDGIVNGAADILDIPCGRIAETLFRAGVDLGISSRGDGSLKKKGGTQEVQEDYWMSTYDFVLDPSVDIARPKLVENVTKNNKLVADAISGLVSSELPEETRMAVLAECLKILGVLEGIDPGDHVLKLSEHIRDILGGSNPTSVLVLQAAKPEPQEESMSGTPNHNPQPTQAPIPPMTSPDTLSWHQSELQKAIAAANAEKDAELDALRRESIEQQREHRELKTRYEAAKEVIEDLHRKNESHGKNDSKYNTLKERYDAAVDLLDEAIKKLKELGGQTRRVETLESLLDSAMKKLMRERVSIKIKECLESAPTKMRDTLEESLAECPNPSQVETTFRRLMAISKGEPIRKEKEPLPEGTPSTSSKKPAPVVESRADIPFAQRLASRMNTL